MNWVDLIIVSLLIFFAIEGWRKSFIGELFYLLSFMLSFFLSLRFYNLAASLFENILAVPHSFANVLGFILIWFLAESIIFPLIFLLIPRIRLSFQIDDFLSRFSSLLAVLRGLIFISILLVLVGTFPIQPFIKQAVTSSVLGSAILNQTGALETPLKRIFGGITQDTLTFLTVKPQSSEKVHLGFQTTNFHADSSFEASMVDLVNKERLKVGLKTLAFDPKLQAVARGHSSDMFVRGYFSHYSPEDKSVVDRANEQGVSFTVIGENLAFAPNLTLAHNGLMNSVGHRANILSEDFNKVGIGIMDGGIYGLMITQVFTN